MRGNSLRMGPRHDSLSVTCPPHDGQVVCTEMSGQTERQLSMAAIAPRVLTAGGGVGRGQLPVGYEGAAGAPSTKNISSSG